MTFATTKRDKWATPEFRVQMLMAALAAGHHSRARLLSKLLTGPMVYKGLAVANEQCLRVIIDAGFDVNNAINIATMYKTASAGLLEGVVALRERGCPTDKWTLMNAAISGNLAMIQYLLDQGCRGGNSFYFAAASYGHTTIVNFAIKNGFCESPPSDACDQAAESGNLDLLKYVRGRGAQWGKSTCSGAALRGHLDILKYLHENGCRWNVRTTNRAAQFGHLECLQYARENGCPVDESTSMYAASVGRLACLKYLHENECPWDEKTPLWAVISNRFDCLRYAVDNGCPWNQEECLEWASTEGYADIIEYCRAHDQEQGKKRKDQDESESEGEGENEHGGKRGRFGDK
jgi:hypothetical protein